MKKLNYKELLILLSYAIYPVILMLILTRGEYIYGSTTDFVTQHAVFPEYIRMLFYDTKDFLPDFMLNLGAGQNIYNISYYGLLNPLIIFSFLFPNISMVNYIIIMMYFVSVSSAYLLYFYLKKNNYSIRVSALIGLMLLCSTSLTFHSMRHIMFVNYMPYLILGLYGVDLYFKENRSYLLIISLTLMLFTSYYYCVGGFLSLVVYGLYRYYKCNKKFNIKTDSFWVLKFCFPFLLAGLISMVLILPTLYTIIFNRASTHVTISFYKMFIPYIELFYDSYSPGLTLSVFIFLIFLFFKGDKIDKIFVLGLILITTIPMFNLILNGFMYIDGKSLIPLTPVILILSAKGLSYLYDNTFFLKYKKAAVIYIIISVILVSVICGFSEELISKNEYYEVKDTNEKLLNLIKDDGFYRINNNYSNKINYNYIYGINQYRSSLYSSTSSIDYLNFNNNNFNTQAGYTKFMMSSTNSILSHIYMAEKYIYTKETLGLGYEFIDSINNVNVYKNTNALSLGYASNSFINSRDFNQLPKSFKSVNVIGNIIKDNVDTNCNYINSTIIDINDIIDFSSLDYEKDGKEIIIDAENSCRLPILKDISGKLMLISFDISNQNYIQEIDINGQLNVLSREDWKYYNDNTTFEYVLTDPDFLDISFSKGIHRVSNFKIELIDFASIVSKVNSVDMFNVDTNKTKGDFIYGSINVTEDSYFTLSIPYDKGFKIKVDGKQTNYELVNNAFIGFPISEGNHIIEIEYEAPFKNIGIRISLSALALSIVYCVCERRKDEETVNSSVVL